MKSTNPPPKKTGPSTDGTGKAQELRRQAEHIFQQKTENEPQELEYMLTEETKQVLHELKVHQIELEMQNEEMRQAQVNLDATRARYFDLYNLAPVGYCTINTEDILLEVNLTAATLLGVTRAALVGRRISSFIFREDQDIYYQHRKHLVETGVSQLSELRMKKADGTLFWAQLVFTVAHNSAANQRQDADDAPVYRVVLSDISALKNSEGRFKESEQNYKNLINSGGALVWTSGKDRLCNFFNGAWLKFTGRTLEQEMGNGWTVGVHPDDLQRCLARYIDAFDRQEKFSMEYRLRRHDGIYLWIINEGSPLYDSQRKFLGYISHCLDIDKRKQVEEELRDSKSIIESVFENIPLMIFLKEPTDLRFVLFNRAGEELLGYDREELLGKNNLDLFPPDQATHFMIKDREVLNGQIGLLDIPEESIDTAKKGRLLLHTKKICIKSADGTSKYLLGISENITERKRLEEEQKKVQAQLQQAQKMEAIGTLAGGIAHDFNNILGAILGYAELAQDDCPSGSMLKNDIQKIIKASNRAINLVKQILIFSRQAETVRSPMQPAIMVEEAAKMLRSLLPSTIEIRQKIDLNAGLILADPTQIHQIVMNLGTNAYHAMEEAGGTLTISLEVKTLTDQDVIDLPGLHPGNFVQLSVGDSGPGIAPEHWDKIFDPYFTTKEIGKGTGMGLSIIHGIVKSYGGSVSFQSQLGVGAVFQILLPILSEEAEVEYKPEEILKLGNERILLVEDEKTLAEIGKKMLRRLGYHVTARTNGLDALRTFKNQPDKFDLIITDQTMPGMTGSDLARRILQISPFMPIILCTGYSSLITEEKARSLGIKGFAMKPLARKSIAVLIRDVLDRGRLPSIKA